MPAAGVNPDAWDQHWAIVSGLAAAKESMDGVLELQYGGPAPKQPRLGTPKRPRRFGPGSGPAGEPPGHRRTQGNLCPGGQCGVPGNLRCCYERLPSERRRRRQGDPGRGLRRGGDHRPDRCQGSQGRALGREHEEYWQEFYKAPEEQATVLGLQIKYLTNQKAKSSACQKYVTGWQDFLASIGDGVDMRA